MEKLCWAWNDGFPVVESSQVEWAEMASIARRRRNSFDHRRPKTMEDFRANRIEDLARGRSINAGGIGMAGPLIIDGSPSKLAEVFLGEPGKTQKLLVNPLR